MKYFYIDSTTRVSCDEDNYYLNDNAMSNEKRDSVVELEAEKAVVEYETPVSGTVSEINEAGQKDTKILDEPDAWLFKVTK